MTQRIVITGNVYDYVLMASNFYNQKERLGQTTSLYNCNHCTYVDFTDAADTSDENEHEFFRHPTRGKLTWTNDTIFDLLNDLYHGRKHALSKPKGYCPKPGQTNVYQLREYLHPADDELTWRC